MSITIAEARRRGFGIELLTPAPKPAPVVEPVVEPPAPTPTPTPTPTPVNVTLDISESLVALEPRVVEVVQNQEVAERFIDALKTSQQAVITAAEKIPARQVVDSCDLEHEWDRGVPVIKTIKFKYSEGER
jgi:hypothetical protein